jgi:FlaA1/EpsC-like NDP-sugar epimerase
MAGQRPSGIINRFGIVRIIPVFTTRSVSVVPKGYVQMPIRVMHMGLGPIGVAVVRQVASRKGFKIVGAVDIDPAKLGKDLGEIAALDRKLKVKVSDNVAATIKASKPDVVLLCTNSALKKIMPSSRRPRSSPTRTTPTRSSRSRSTRWRRRPAWPCSAPASIRAS